MKLHLSDNTRWRSTSLTVVTTAVALVLAVPTTAHAQAVELGTDAVVQTSIGSDQNTTAVAIPAAYLRIGVYTGSLVSLEPRVGLISASSGGTTATIYSASLSMLLHFSQSPVGVGPYIRPFAGVTGTGGETSTTQASAGIGVGASFPMTGSLATRVEANYTHAFSSSDFDSANAIGASIGLSYFIR
jgi:hypothetical protein